VVFVPPDPIQPPDSIRVRLRFLDAASQPILNFDHQPVEREVVLLPGQSASLELPASYLADPAGPAGERGDFRPEVTVAKKFKDRLLLSAEVFDNATGITRVVHPQDPIRCR